jgi:hypothetical protein
MEGKSHARTSISTSVKISLDPTSKCVDSILYKSMIRSLLYITTTIHFFLSNVRNLYINETKLENQRVTKYLQI